MLAAGRITKLFGAEGEVNISLYDDCADVVDWMGQPLFVRLDGLVVPLFCEEFVRRGQAATARFADIDTPRRAEMVVGCEIFVEGDNEELSDDEFTFDDLVGFKVSIGDATGEIIDYYDSELNPLFEIRLTDETLHLIPAAEEFIAAIDFEEGSMHLVLPEGLLELE